MGCCYVKDHNKKIISSTSPNINNQIYNINISNGNYPLLKENGKMIDVNYLKEKDNEICFDIYNNQKSIKEILETNKIKLRNKGDSTKKLLLKENISTNDLCKVNQSKDFNLLKKLEFDKDVSLTTNIEIESNTKLKPGNTICNSLKPDDNTNISEFSYYYSIISSNVNRKKFNMIKLELSEIFNDTTSSNNYFFSKTISSLGTALINLKDQISRMNENDPLKNEVNYDNPLIIKNNFKKSTNVTEIDLIISSEANMYNCWFEENDSYSININGKWALDFSLPIIDYEGYEGEEFEGHPLGCILGRISNDTNWFPIVNNMIFYPRTSGFLFLKINCNPYLKSFLKPDGSAIISIKSCIRLSKEDFNNKIQFYKSLAFQSDLSNDLLSVHSDFENSVLNYINQIRLDTKKFANCYLKDYQFRSDKYKTELFRFLTNEKTNKTPNYLFERNEQIYTIISKNRGGLKPELKLKIIANSILKDLEKSKIISYEKYDKYANFYSSKFIIHKIFTRNNLDSFNTSIEIVLNKSDINKTLRKEIMSEKYSYIGLGIKSFKNSSRIICIVLSSKEDSK